VSKKRDDFTLYQRPPSKVWWVRKRRKGKEFRISLDTEDKGLGRERAEKWIKELIATDWGEMPAKTFSDAMLRYAEERFSSLSDGGKRYATSIEHLSAHFGDVEMDKIKPSSLSAFVNKRLREVSPSTVRRDLSTLSAIFVQAQLWEWASTNPVRPFVEARGKIDLIEGEPRIRYLSRDEEEALLRYAGDTFRDLFALDIDTGLRLGELKNLGWANVKLDLPNTDAIPTRGQILIEKKRTKTKGASRMVPLLDRSYDFLKYAEKKSLTVFATSDGKAYSRNSPTIWEALQKAARKAGIEDLTIHDLRRTCGCRLLQDYKARMEVVSRWLGHSSVRVTERHYAFLEVEQLHEAVEEGRANVIRIEEMRAKIKAAGHK
jgi:integrase